MKRSFLLFLIWMCLLTSVAGAVDSTLRQAQDSASSPQEDSSTLDFANGLYKREMYGPAAEEYEKFLAANSKGGESFDKLRMVSGVEPPGQIRELASVHFRLAESYFFLKDFKKATSRYESFLEKFPSDDRVPIARYRLGRIAYDDNHLEAALRYFQDAQNKTTDPEVKTSCLFYSGKIQKTLEITLLETLQTDLDSGKFEAVIEDAQNFTVRFPDSPFLDLVYYKMGIARTALKDYENAALTFRTVVDRFPSSRVYVEALYGLAASLDGESKFQEAIAVYKRILIDYPNHSLSVAVTRRLASLYLQIEDFRQAGAFYRDLLLHRPDIEVSSDEAFWLVRYLIDEGEYTMAIKILDKIKQRFPKGGLEHQIDFFLGESSLYLKDYASALQFYSKAVEEKADGVYAPDAYLGMGIVYAAQGNDAAAETSFNKVLEFNHETEVATRAYFELANLRQRAEKT